MKTWHAKGEEAALPFFQRAVELDPKFAMAYARMGSVYSGDDSALSSENERKAYELRDKVSERERLYIEAHYYDHVTGEMEKAAQVYEVWQQIYPRDVEPYQNLCDIYAAFGNYEKALEETREALRLQPDNEENYLNVGHYYISLNRLDDAEAVFKQAEDRQLESGPLLYVRHELAFLKGDTGEMERLVATSVGKPGGGYIHNRQAWAEAYHGRLRKARELFRPETSGGCLVCAGLALIEAQFGEGPQARADADAALRVAGRGDTDTQYWVMLALALAGDVPRAEKLAAELDKRHPLNTIVQRYWLPTIRAVVAMERKDANQAVELLREMSPYELGAPCLLPVYERGRAYLMLHDGSAAAAEFWKIINHPGIVEKCLVGALAHLGLARAYALQGDNAKSRAAYQHFFMLWKDADPDIPIVKEAKAEYAKLQ
jgi:eukaryotic-like serine/threonine-protein kinase